MSVSKNNFEKILGEKLEQEGLSSEEGIRIYNRLFICLRSYVSSVINNYDLDKYKLIFRIPFLGSIATKRKYKKTIKEEK